MRDRRREGMKERRDEEREVWRRKGWEEEGMREGKRGGGSC